MKKATTLLVIVLMLILLISGCGEKESGDFEIVIAQGVDATTLDPHIHNETPSANVTSQIFDRLFLRDQNMELVPKLAKEYEIVDELTWKVSLKEEIVFHNGEPFTADAVKFSIERIIDPETQSPQMPNYSMIDRVDIVDDYTVKIITKEPYPLLLGRLSLLAIVPPEYIQEVGREGFAENPIGTGPFVFESWERDEEIVLKANNDYWQGEPTFQEVVFRTIPENSVRIAELKSGSADLIVNVPPHQVEEVDHSPGLKVKSVPSGRIIFVQWVTDKEGVTSDPIVRQAIQHAVHQEDIIESILEGFARPLDQPLTEDDFGYHPGIQPREYDPNKAQELLAEHGYEDPVLIVIDSPAGRYAMDKEVAEAIKGQLEQAGFQVDLRFNEWGVHVNKILEREMEGGYLIGWGSSLFDADATLYSNFHSTQRISFYENDRVDELLEQARSTLDESSRKAYYHEAIEIITDEAAVLPLYQPEDIYGMQENLVWSPRPDEMIYVFDMEIN